MKIEELINDNHSTFSEGEKVLAKFILNNKDDIYDLGINELAKKSLSSKSSVLRFAQKLGFSGYTEMKNFMKWENQTTENPITQEDFGKMLISNVEQTVNQLNKMDFSKVCEVIERSSNVYITGTGLMQQSLAQEMQRMFLGIGKNMQTFPMDISTNIYQLVTERISEEDMLIVFSGSGNNPTLKEALSIPLIKNVNILAITGSHHNWLMNNATFGIAVNVNNDSTMIRNWFASSSAFHSVIEILAYNYFEYKNKSLKNK
ncbi:MurR/RpiR family transcriptional regulator [Halalkalibacter sp. APA_J-10(15)]|uniref:MurR/RpiR family transcriptional regulator n=1 Tax=unclassified Halalkalibacter TaxID=2893063 RepID=UPI001FF58E0F|nr:MurR/RpiR family transcriptional regulator [Halalkalibacter sp. APA_J-10(15)]MCK0473441.1 MurR/RpiR family transcriptional regulator [Halalkalibacter sp. APA_J-10(15)]